VRRRMSLRFWLAVLVTLVSLSPGAVFAYNLEGPTWGNQPSPGTCCASLGFNLSTTYSVDNSGWPNGQTAWDDSPALIVYGKNGSSLISLRDTYNSGVSWDGLTQYSYNIFNNFTSSTGTLNYYYTSGYSTGEIESVATHELGHVAGLAHSNGCVIMVGDTYTRWTSCGIDTPQTDDDNGINAMY
jgi:hypothetical protein